MSPLTTKRVATGHDVKASLDELYRLTGGRGKRWEAVRAALISLSVAATIDDTGARKAALEGAPDSLKRKYSV